MEETVAGRLTNIASFIPNLALPLSVTWNIYTVLEYDLNQNLDFMDNSLKDIWGVHEEIT